jgi:hypothetical protein
MLILNISGVSKHKEGIETREVSEQGNELPREFAYVLQGGTLGSGIPVRDLQAINITSKYETKALLRRDPHLSVGNAW